MPPRRQRHQSVTKAFTEFFNQLRDFVNESEISYPLHPKLYIDTDQNSDRAIEFLEVISIFSPLTSIIGCKFTFDDKYFFATNGISNADFNANEAYFTPVELSAGFFIRLVLELNIPISPHSTPLDIYNKILSVADGEDVNTPKAINFEACKSMFCEIQVYEIENGPTFNEASAEKMLGYFVTNKIKPYLKYKRETETEFKLIFENNNNNLPYDLILFAFVASNYKYAFVELYRCIERIYPLPALKSLRAKLPDLSEKNPLLIAKILEDELNWRPKEEESLTKLTSDLSFPVVDLLQMAKSAVPEFASFELSRFIYRLRNLSVHYRDALGQAKITDYAWDLLIRGLLKHIDESYQAYESELNIQQEL